MGTSMYGVAVTKKRRDDEGAALLAGIVTYLQKFLTSHAH